MPPPSTPTEEHNIAAAAAADTCQRSIFNISDIAHFSSASARAPTSSIVLGIASSGHTSSSLPDRPPPLTSFIDERAFEGDGSILDNNTIPAGATVSPSSHSPYPTSSILTAASGGRGGPIMTAPTSSSSSTKQHHQQHHHPTLVMPRDWTVPSYLKYSVFYDRFTVSSSSSVSIVNNAASSSSSASASSSSMIAAAGGGPAVVVDPYQGSTSSWTGTYTSSSGSGGSSGSTTTLIAGLQRTDGSNWGPTTIYPSRSNAYMGSSAASLAPPPPPGSGSAAAPAAALSSSSSSSQPAQSAQSIYTERLSNSHSRIHLPTKLDPKHCCKRLLIQDDILQFCPEKDDQGRDKLNRHDPDKDAAAVRADHPIPSQAGVYYFEVQVISKGQKGYIGIGFSSRAVDLERLPGWNPESYGYHGDDGKAFSCSGTGSAYSERFGSGDTIGCGIDFLAKRAFFVKNGKWLGYVFDLTNAIGEREDPTLKPGYGNASGLSRRDRERGKLRETPGTAPLQLYPTIGLQTPGETVKVNFGQEPFQFDIDSFVKRRQREMTASILSHPIPSSFKQALAPGFPQLPFISSSTSSPSSSRLNTGSTTRSDADAEDPHLKACLENLVASYLNHRGFSDTARSFRKQRQTDRSECRNLISQSALSTGNGSHTGGPDIPNGDSASNEASGSSTPVKKKTKKKADTSSKKLLKSALRTTLVPPVGKDEDDSQMDIEDSSLGPDGFEGASLDTSRNDMSGVGMSSFSASMTDDLMISDVKGKGKGLADDLEADEAELTDTLRRQSICAALRRGNIDYAMQEIEEHYPAVLHPSPDDKLKAMLNGLGGAGSTQEESAQRRAELLFRLRCRKFIELILASVAASKSEDTRLADKDTQMEGDADEDEDEQVASQLLSSTGAPALNATFGDPSKDSGSIATKGSSKLASPAYPEVSLEQVLEYGAKLNSLYPSKDSNVPPRVLAKLKTVFSLVAYADPADLTSHGNVEIYNLTRQEERDELAETINKAMLESKGQPGIPYLELVHRQAFAVRNVLGDVFGEGAAALVGDAITM